jgi:hypothetical protein
MASETASASERANEMVTVTAFETASTYEMAGAYISAYETAFERACEKANTMENEVINRALTVVKTKPEWIDYIKNFNEDTGFMFAESSLLYDIKDAIDRENPIHSGASLAMSLQKCKVLLNKL